MNLRLLVMQGRPAGKALVFAPGQYFLGRGEECHVRFNSEWVSRQHCKLDVRGDVATLSDLGSRNGTLVNGQLVREELPLREGDQVQIGAVVFKVQFDAPAREGPAETPSDQDVFISGDQDAGEVVSMDSTAHMPALTPKEPKAKRSPPP